MTSSPQTFQTQKALLIVGLVALSLCAGCGPGSGQGLDENGNLLGQSNGAPAGGGGGGGAASGNPDATLAWVQGNVFVPICSLCHTGGTSAPQGVDWTASHICLNVGRQSGEISTMKEIESGNPDASYMIWKIQGAGPRGPGLDSISGGQMPLNLTPLAPNTIQNMRDWIADGVPGC
jgi:hypothetical protein